jgi:glutathione S-transferase
LITRRAEIDDARAHIMSSTRYTLIGAEVSYYTAKVRAYLRYKQLPFDELAASRDVYRDVIVPRTGVRFIPVLLTDDGSAIQDSRAIIDHLEARHPSPRVTPEEPLGELIALLLELYADEWLLLPAMHYRWNVPENRAFAIEEFGRLSLPNASPADQRALGEKLAGPFAGALPHLGVHPGTVPAIESSYQELLSELDAHLTQHAYMLGSRPCIGDFALFGPLYAHLYRDPASGRLMKQRAPRVAAWVERMKAGAAVAPESPEVPLHSTTIEPVLARAFRELGPVLESTIAALATFPADTIDTPLPRSLGRHAFTLAGVTAARAIYPFNLWRWQRAYDHYWQLSESDRRLADPLIERIGARKILDTSLTRRLSRRANQLYVA